MGRRQGGTHCSGFVAAACQRLGIYLLRPPEHDQKNPANAQCHWLETEVMHSGWSPVPGPGETQRLANLGQVVGAVHLSPDPERSGHIPLVRPSAKPDSVVQSEGPQIIQAGGTNHASTSVKTGFRLPKGAWTNADHQQLRLFAHSKPQ